MAIITSYGRDPAQVTAISSLVSDKKSCSLVNNYENMPRRGNRCDIVSSRDFPEVFWRLRHVFGDLSEANVWQLSPHTGGKLPGWLRTAAS